MFVPSGQEDGNLSLNSFSHALIRQHLTSAYNNVEQYFQSKQLRKKKIYDCRLEGFLHNVGDKVWLHSSVLPCGGC